MTEKSDVETRPKKVVSRNIAVYLGIISVVLLVFSIGTLIQNVDLQNRLDSWNKIDKFQQTLYWDRDFDFVLHAGQVYREAFEAGQGGNVKVSGNVEPAISNSYWVNLSYFVIYGTNDSYTVYPKPYVDYEGPSSFSFEYPIVSFNQINASPDVFLQIGNSLSNSSITMNVNVTFTY